MILAHIKETLGLKIWGSSDLQVGPEETRILRNWGVTSILEFIGHHGGNNKIRIILDTWVPPPANMHKLNFDAASKGNLGWEGFGGAICNSNGKLESLYWGYMGRNSNNILELRGLLASLTMGTQHGWMPIILEGDSQVILQMATKLLHGRHVSKVVE